MLTRIQLAHRLRQHVARELIDDSCLAPVGTAIYSLADPRDLRLTRYIGQTSSPRRRFLQHLNCARLWLPDERPWWIVQPKLRPLYDWLRELHAQDGRLPTMVVHDWTSSLRAARLAERARICDALAHRLPLLNVECETQGRQLLLV
jgi:hypothetical protein